MMKLQPYHQKRNFGKTTEPEGRVHSGEGRLFVIQKHAASHLHYDLRLELKGVLLSWAVPKGPSLNPGVKRLAIQVEDHPLEYGSFEGIIPEKQYGAGTVLLWDRGKWKALDADPEQAWQKGHLRFILEAEKLRGRWDLVRFKEKHWFLIKYADKFAETSPDSNILEEKPDSVLSHQSLEDLGQNCQKFWNSEEKKRKLMPPKQLSKVAFPSQMSPMLATLSKKAPSGKNWLHEVKFDGYRILAFINKEIHLKSRNNRDWTAYFPNIAQRLKIFLNTRMILDGELVLLDAKGKPDFQLLQNALDNQQAENFVYYIFDILYYDACDLTSLPLLKRKAFLRSLLPENDGQLRYSDHLVGNGEEIFRHSCTLGLEGILSKKTDSAWQSGRSRNWLKVKCSQRQEFVIAGYSKPCGNREYFGALYLGLYNEARKFCYAGKVGTGFTQKSLQSLYSKMQKLRIDDTPFRKKIPAEKEAIWIKPQLVAEIEFSEWTNAGLLRHPVFKGLRKDKKVDTVVREKEAPMSLKITHPEKILYPEDGISKQELFDYYERVSAYILPFIKNRPLSLLRCPETREHCFFQRHYTRSMGKALKKIPLETRDGLKDFIYLENWEGLASLVQMNILEIHPWGSMIDAIENPDWLVLDLDPDPDLPWSEMVRAAFEIREYLKAYPLQSFLKTTGGKGLHIVIPIIPEYSWEEVKNFTHALVQSLEKTRPERYVSSMAKKKRRGKIFVDYLRNQRSATAIAAWSTRARIAAPVSVPLHWDELTNDKRDSEFTLRTLDLRLANLKSDPWENFWKTRQSLGLNINSAKDPELRQDWQG